MNVCISKLFLFVAITHVGSIIQGVFGLEKTTPIKTQIVSGVFDPVSREPALVAAADNAADAAGRPYY